MESHDRPGVAPEGPKDVDALRGHLVEQIARRVPAPPGGIDPDRPLEEFGLASRDAVAIAGELERLLGRALPATLVWEHPTINKLSAALAGGEPATATPVPAHPRGDEPIAVVGIGCRFPGGDRDLCGPDDYWRFLIDSGDGIREVPEGRWEAFDDGSPETADLLSGTTRLGGYLDDIALFDAQFFGITPREAAVMDPQQRLMLEVAWEAFEHAGLAPAALRGGRTGVFVGVSAPEYAALTASDLAALEPFTATGASLGIVAGRLSYLLDLRGPSMIVDTACSSSLVSAHLAVQALRRGEADVALAGGVNLLLSPAITMTFDRAGATAADGRCKAFDASADGMVRAEGCGAVVLKRLPDALRDGDRVLAVIRGSGVNSDGRSNGLVAPSSDAQKALLREVYAAAGIDPAEVGYVEAHGTGTLLGDPIEAVALGEVLGAGSGRDADDPLLIGSAKSNFGHLEPAAGVAGLIKTVLALHHGRLPPSAHFREPNPHIPFGDLRLSVVTEETPWPGRRRPARAGVSAFGFGGTNAHLVLEEAPAAKSKGDPVAVREYPLSDVADDRVRDHAGTLAGWLEGREDVRLSDLAVTLQRRAGRGRFRAAVAARDRAGLLDGLTALAEGRPHPAVVTGVAGGVPGRPVWVFSGYGAQRPGMAKRLLEEEPAFTEAVDDLDTLFQEEGGPPLWTVLEQGRGTGGPATTMPVLFAVQVALARTLHSYGVTPGAVIGHSMGEVAAAVVAGALTTEDGVKVICRRSRLLTRLVGGGAMAVLGASAEEVTGRLAADLPEVHVAVRSSPKQTVVTGDAAQIATVLERAEAEGRLASPVKAEGAGHSPQVDPLLDDLRDELAGIGAEPGTPLAEGIRLYSTALDDPRAGPDSLDAGYWAANLRNPVRLADAVAVAAEDGFRTFIEVNAHPILGHGIGETLEGTGALVTHTLRRAPKGQETDDSLTLHAQLAAFAAHGVRDAVPTGDGHVIDVPLPPWRHERYWAAPTAPRTANRDEHPLLGAHVELPGEERHAWRADLGTAAFDWPDEAAVHGIRVLPVAAVAEMAIAAGCEGLGLGADEICVSGLWMERRLALAESTVVTTTFSESEQRVEVHAQTAAGTWVRVAGADVGVDQQPVPDLPDGPVTGIAGAERGSRHYRLHPEVFGRCLSVLSAAAAAAAAGSPAEGDVWLPGTIGGLRVHGPAHRGGHVHTGIALGDDGAVGAIRLAGPDGRVLVEATGIVLRRVRRAGLPVPLDDKLVRVVWDESDVPEPAITAGTFLVLAEDDDALAGAVAVGLEARGHRVIRHRLAGSPPGGHPPVQDPPDAVVLVPPADLVDEPLVLTVAGVSRSLPDGTRLWIATRGALPVLDGEGGEPNQGFVRALTRVLAFERTAQRATLVDTDRPSTVVTEILGDGDAREVAWRRGVRRVARLTRASLADASRDPRPLAGASRDRKPLAGASRDRERFGDASRDRDLEPLGVPPVQTAAVGRHAAGSAVRRRMARRGAAYVITGGYGGIGLVTARLLAERGAGRIVVSGRSGPGAAAEKVLARLRESGVDIGVVPGDIADPGVAGRLVAAAREGGIPLRGVLHGAGAIDDRLIADLGPEDLRRVWRAKVEGARWLSAATWDLDLDWFVLHSSAAALVGSPGQAAYAAANAALDALAAYRTANGRPATSVNWGTWSRVGGAAALGPAATGPTGPTGPIEPITPEEGAEALEVLLAHASEGAGVLRFDADAAVSLFPEIQRNPYFAALTEEATGPERGWPGLETLTELGPDAAARAVADRVRFRIAAVLGFEPGRLDPSVPLTDLGLDSLLAVRIKSGVEHDLGLTVPAAVLLRGASVSAFQEWACARLGLGAAPAAPAAAPGYVMPRDAAERLAVRIFEDVLGLDRVSVTAGFHTDLGGDEHQADQVVAQVAARLAREVTRSELFEVPTAEHVAAFIRSADEAEAARQPVRPLHAAAGSARPLFIAHPAGGTTVCYRPLAELLGPDQPVYGLERFEDAPSVEERAARYVRHLMEAQPYGAFRLGGWSFGGVLAYETARQLTGAGREVEFVALFDAGLPLPVEDESDTLARRFAAFADYINETYALNVSLTYEELAGLPEAAQLALVMDRAEPLVEHIPPAALKHQLTSHQDTRSLEAYGPRPYGGRVVLYRAPEETPWAVKDARYVLDGANGFGDLCPALEIVTVPGAHHLNLLDPPAVEFMAAHLKDHLAG